MVWSSAIEYHLGIIKYNLGIIKYNYHLGIVKYHFLSYVCKMTLPSLRKSWLLLVIVVLSGIVRYCLILQALEKPFDVLIPNCDFPILFVIILPLSGIILFHVGKNHLKTLNTGTMIPTIVHGAILAKDNIAPLCYTYLGFFEPY